jgi:hypothetical protein
LRGQCLILNFAFGGNQEAMRQLGALLRRLLPQDQRKVRHFGFVPAKGFA